MQSRGTCANTYKPQQWTGQQRTGCNGRHVRHSTWLFSRRHATDYPVWRCVIVLISWNKLIIFSCEISIFSLPPFCLALRTFWFENLERGYDTLSTLVYTILRDVLVGTFIHMHGIYGTIWRPSRLWCTRPRRLLLRRDFAGVCNM
jgi:hypothetical protein